MKYFCITLMCVLSFFSFTQNKVNQKKELTLKESVLQQYRLFAPESLNRFSWIPGTNRYSYFDEKGDLIGGTTHSKSTSILFSLTELRGISLNGFNDFTGFTWKSNTVFSLFNGIKYQEISIVSKQPVLSIDLAENAANQKNSLDGNRIAFTIDNNLYVSDKNSQEQITAFTDKNIVSGQSIARNEFGIGAGIFWSYDSKSIAFYQKDETEVHNYPLLDITSTQGEVDFIKYPMTGQKSEKPKVGIFNLNTKKTVYINPSHNADDYLTNLAWTPDDKYVIIVEVNRGQDHMWLNVYDALTGAFVKTLFEEQNSKWVEPENPVFFPSKSVNNFVWISQRDGFNNLYYYDFDGKLISQLTKNQFVAKNILGMINKNKELVFMATGESPLDMKFYAVDLKGKQRLITTDPGTHSLIIGNDGAYFYDVFSSHSIPSVSRILDRSGKTVNILLEGTDKLKEYAIGETEINTIKANDGTLLYTRLIKPSNFDPTKKYPVLTYVYGGPHAQMIQNEWLDGSNLWMHWMAEKGYLIFTVDNRGSGNRGFVFESVIHRRLGNVEMDDQLTGVSYLKSLPFVDSNRLAIHGWSFGGFMTTSMMLRNPGVYKVGVAGGPVTDWKFYETMYGERYMDMPEENPEGYKTSSLLNYAQNLKGDLLLIHGTNDDVVVMQHDFALIKKFVELGVQMDFFPYPMHKHNVYGKDRVHLMDKILTYILENNK